jgi:hypothetical protein
LNSSRNKRSGFRQFVRITCICRYVNPSRIASARATGHRVRTATPIAHIDCQRALCHGQWQPYIIVATRRIVKG